MNRRHFVKTLAIAPLLFTKPASAISMFGSCSCVNILLHGFFFLEFQKDENDKDMLVVATPPYPYHEFGCRDHGRWRLQNPSMCDSDLRTKLAPGSKLKFPTKMLSFSKTDLQIGHPFIDVTKAYPILLKLPPPLDIVPLRLGKRSDVHLLDGKAKRSIDSYCDPTFLGLVLRLKYDSASPTDPLFPKTRNFYAEHCNLPDINEMKNILNAARASFGNEFDLDMADIPPAVVPSDKQNDLPDEISPDDESAIMEGDPCFAANFHSLKRQEEDERSVEPATCPIFGVRS